MTIKTKLIANVLVTAVIVVAISLASFLSMRFIQEKLTYLTEKSTPFQIRTIELQRDMQRAISAMLKVNSARNMSEYMTFLAEAEKFLYSIEEAEEALDKISNGTQGVSNELINIALELFIAAEDRIISNIAATSANAEVLKSMKESSARLNDLDIYISNLQSNYSQLFAAAMENTATYSGRLKSIEELRNMVRDLQLIAVTVQNSRNSSALLIARGKLRAVAVRIAKNDYLKANQSIAAVSSGFIVKLTEYIKLQSVAVSQKDDVLINRTEATGKDIIYKLNDLFQMLDQETMLVRDELSLASGKQRNVFLQSGTANDILAANSQLKALGLTVTSEINRLFTLNSVDELDKLDATIHNIFSKIDERVHMLESALTRQNAMEELKILRAAAASLTAVRTKIYSADGIISTLKKKHKSIEQANISADKLHAIVIRQAAQGNERVSAARIEREKSIADVNHMVRRSLSQILGIGFAAIVIGIFFGFWIYRSVLLPLRMVLDAVHYQKEQVKEKAALAESVAGGDLTGEVAISEAITLDQTRINSDEMGMVLNAIVVMSEAQVTLDRAFAGMTASLRSSRDEETRRDRLKSGLNELNRILRTGYKTEELGDRIVAFLADFLGSGVGVMYLYDDKNGMLQTLSTYAIARSGRLNEGFRLGEGVAGQVALEQKMICLNSIPPNYLPITSALGEAEPLNIAIMPIMHNETLVGVLELGSFKRYSDDDFVFLNQSLEGIAIAINVNRSHQRVNDLLEQTQAQAEELRVQQEELQQTNEELAERAGLR